MYRSMLITLLRLYSMCIQHLEEFLSLKQELLTILILFRVYFEHFTVLICNNKSADDHECSFISLYSNTLIIIVYLFILYSSKTHAVADLQEVAGAQESCSCLRSHEIPSTGIRMHRMIFDQEMARYNPLFIAALTSRDISFFRFFFSQGSSVGHAGSSIELLFSVRFQLHTLSLF